MLEIMLAGPYYLKLMTAATAPFRWHRNAAHSGQILAGDAVRGRDDAGRRAIVHNPAAVHTGFRADIDKPVALAHGFLIMLYHNHGVA